MCKKCLPYLRFLVFQIFRQYNLNKDVCQLLYSNYLDKLQPCDPKGWALQEWDDCWGELVSETNSDTVEICWHGKHPVRRDIIYVRGDPDFEIPSYFIFRCEFGYEGHDRYDE